MNYNIRFSFSSLLSCYVLAVFAHTSLNGNTPIMISQAQIPITISQPGEYELAGNITYNGSGSAITVAANNVKLTLQFSISLSNPNATGILVRGASEFVIANDFIKNLSTGPQTGFGIHIENAQKGLIKNIFTINHKNGLLIESSRDIKVQGSEFFTAADASALVRSSTTIAFDSCTFDASAYGLTFSGSNKDCSVSNSAFPSAKLSNLLVQQMDGMLVDTCSFTNIAGEATKANLVQFGDAAPTQVCNDVIIKNCTIVNKSTNKAPEGLGIYHGSGFLVESCVIDIDNTGQDPAADLSGIHISNPGLGNGTIATNVIIRQCVIQGPATDGIYPDTGPGGSAGSQNILIENCLVTGAQKDGIFLAGTGACTVRDNVVVNNGTNGIFVGETSVSNLIINNAISNNGSAIIRSSLLPRGNGIGIASDSSKNIIQGNQVYNNAVYGIDDLGTNNQSFFNTAYGNATANYSAGITNNSSPGAASKAAENISA